MTGFYSSDKRIMGWLHGWIVRGCSTPHLREAERAMLAAQLRIIRKRHGGMVAQAYNRHLTWIGSYPLKRG